MLKLIPAIFFPINQNLTYKMQAQVIIQMARNLPNITKQSSKKIIGYLQRMIRLYTACLTKNQHKETISTSKILKRVKTNQFLQSFTGKFFEKK